MNDLILQWIFLPITIAMYGVEALGKAVSAAQSSTEPAVPPVSGPPVAGALSPTPPPAPVSAGPGNQGGAGTKPVPYHPKATESCCQG